jgi:hypothetical protein
LRHDGGADHAHRRLARNERAVCGPRWHGPVGRAGAAGASRRCSSCSAWLNAPWGRSCSFPLPPADLGPPRAACAFHVAHREILIAAANHTLIDAMA